MDDGKQGQKHLQKNIEIETDNPVCNPYFYYMAGHYNVFHALFHRASSFFIFLFKSFVPCF